jgi:putative DNA primase/helicase
MADEWPFPPLLGVISTPTLRPDGSLLDRPGYDPATGLVLFEPPPMPPIPAEPSKDDALLALKVIDALLAEFPYSDDKAASRSVALSMLMTPVLRAAIGPAVPLHIAKAPAGGTGKSYLADISSGIAVGEPCPVIAVAPNAEETEKRLIGAALTGQAIIAIDNCNGELRSPFLCQAVERPLLQVRALGSSDLARIGNKLPASPTATTSRSPRTWCGARSSARLTPTWNSQRHASSRETR